MDREDIVDLVVETNLALPLEKEELEDDDLPF